MTAKGTVERVAKRRYHLHCSCGATVVTGERTATCPDCGQIVMFRRDLRRRKHTLGDTPTETFLWAPVGIRGTSQTKPDAPMDCNRRFKRAGFLMLYLRDSYSSFSFGRRERSKSGKRRRKTLDRATAIGPACR